MRPYTFIVKDTIISIIKFISYQLYSSTTLYPGYRIIFSPRVQPPTRPPRRAELNAPPVAGFLSGRFLWMVFFFVPQSPDRGHNLATRGPAGAPNLPPRSAPVPPCASRSGASLRCPLLVMPLRSSHRRSGEWRLPHASYWPGPARPHIQGFPASDRDCGWWFLRFRRQDGVPFVRSATSCGMGARMQRRRRPAAAQLPHGLLKLAISSKVLSSVCIVPLPPLHSIPTVLLYFPRMCGFV